LVPYATVKPRRGRSPDTAPPHATHDRNGSDRAGCRPRGRYRNRAPVPSAFGMAIHCASLTCLCGLGASGEAHAKVWSGAGFPGGMSNCPPHTLFVRQSSRRHQLTSSLKLLHHGLAGHAMQASVAYEHPYPRPQLLKPNLYIIGCGGLVGHLSAYVSPRIRRG
jgi:hypothetical protein